MRTIAIKMYDSGHKAFFKGDYDDTSTSDKKVFVPTDSNHNNQPKAPSVIANTQRILQRLIYK